MKHRGTMCNKLQPNDKLNKYEFAMLLDFYGQLLTSRQYEIMYLHYNNDYSLGEIAEHYKISRQGVYDIIKRARLFLCDMEEKLHLVERFEKQRSAVCEAVRLLNSIDVSMMNENTALKFKELKSKLLNIVE